MLCGCVPKPVPVVLDCPRIVLPMNPAVPLTHLNAKSTPDEVIKAWITTATLYRDWNVIVRRQVESSLA